MELFVNLLCVKEVGFDFVFNYKHVCIHLKYMQHFTYNLLHGRLRNIIKLQANY